MLDILLLNHLPHKFPTNSALAGATGFTEGLLE